MEKLRLDFAKSKGYVAAAGDAMIHVDGLKLKVNICMPWNVCGGGDKEWFVTSFAERENKGEQPASNYFPVVVYFKDGRNDKGRAAAYNWSKSASCIPVSKWKPDYNRLLKMQHEHDKQNESIIKACDEANKKESEMTYTQEMKDNGELPKVGMKCEVKYNGGNTFRNAIIKFISDYGIVHSDTETGVEIFCGEINEIDIHPPRTQEEIELEEAKKKQVEDLEQEYYGLNLTFNGLLKRMQRDGHLAEPK